MNTLSDLKPAECRAEMKNPRNIRKKPIAIMLNAINGSSSDLPPREIIWKMNATKTIREAKPIPPGPRLIKKPIEAPEARLRKFVILAFSRKPDVLLEGA